jgi:hypothetical protein
VSSLHDDGSVPLHAVLNSKKKKEYQQETTNGKAREENRDQIQSVMYCRNGHGCRSGQLDADPKRKRPRPVESWGVRRTALPRSLFLSSLVSGAGSGNGSDGLLERIKNRDFVRCSTPLMVMADGRLMAGCPSRICAGAVELLFEMCRIVARKGERESLNFTETRP